MARVLRGLLRMLTWPFSLLLRPFRRRRNARLKRTTDGSAWPLEMVLFAFGEAKMTLRDVLTGIGVLGGTGSGKSSGSGQLIARSFLASGFGGLVLCAKKDRQIWESYAALEGRSDDLVIFGVNQPWRFNFLDFELNRQGEGAGLTQNVINLFLTVLEVAERSSGQQSGGDEPYWKRALQQLLRNLIDLLVLATGHISIPELYKLAVSAPISLEQVGSEAWKKRSFCFACLQEADKREKTPSQLRDFALTADYFLLELPALSEKTRSVILSTFTSLVDVLNRGVLRELFCTDTNITPLACEAGKIILIDLPVKEFGDVGLFANVLWKYCFQQSIERRDVKASPRPVLLWQDEGHVFTCAKDMDFQLTARSSRAANVILTQSISTFYAAMGGDGQKAKAQVDSLFGNLNLKIFHANADAVTNQWASDMIGRTRQFFINASTSRQHADVYSAIYGGEGSQSSGGFSEQMEYEIPPTYWHTNLRTGGVANNFEVDGLLFCPAMCFKATGRNYLPVTFLQR